MTEGVGLFGRQSGFIAARFRAPTAKKNRDELEMLRQEQSELLAMLEPVVKAAAAQGDERSASARAHSRGS